MKGFWSPSSSGLGLRPFTAATGVRLPLGTPSFYARFFHIPGKSTPRKINYFSFSIIRIKIFTILPERIDRPHYVDSSSDYDSDSD